MSLNERELKLQKQSQEHLKSVQERRRSSAYGYHNGKKSRSEENRESIEESMKESL